MPTPILGLGTAVSIDAKTIDLIVNAKPPGREREGVPYATLDATLEIETPGIEKMSEFTIQLLRDPDDTDQSSLWTLFNNKTVVSCIITFTDATATTWTFSGWVKKIDPGTIEKGAHNTWDVTLSRTTAITVA